MRDGVGAFRETPVRMGWRVLDRNGCRPGRLSVRAYGRDRAVREPPLHGLAVAPRDKRYGGRRAMRADDGRCRATVIGTMSRRWAQGGFGRRAFHETPLHGLVCRRADDGVASGGRSDATRDNDGWCLATVMGTTSSRAYQGGWRTGLHGLAVTPRG